MKPREFWIRKKLQKGVNYAFDPDNVELCEENAKNDFWIVIEKFAYQDWIRNKSAAYDAVVAENKKLRAALEFYADKKHWAGEGDQVFYSERPGGQEARQVLGMK